MAEIDWNMVIGFIVAIGVGYVNHLISFNKLQSKVDSEIKLVKQDYNAKIKEVKTITDNINNAMTKLDLVLEKMNETQTELKIAITKLTSEIKSLNKHNKNDDDN